MNATSTPTKVGVIAANLVVAAVCVLLLTKSYGPVVMTVGAVAIASIFVVKSNSLLRAGLSVYAVALVIGIWWFGMRKLGIVP